MKKLALYIVAFILLGGIGSCENPLKDFELAINTQVINNYATLRIVDANGNNINGVSVSLVSGDTEDIYNMNGHKDFKPTDNLVTFGLDPKRMVAAGAPVNFRASIAANGYTTQVVSVSITENSTGIETVVLNKPSQTPEGVEEVTQTFALGPNGETTEVITVSLASADGEGQVGISIPAGTQFRDADGNLLSGSNLQVTVGSLDAGNTDAQSMLPGGSLRSDQVVLEGGATAAGAFSPAAITEINMVINGISVRQFSQPLTVSLPVSADYVSPVSGQAIAAGGSFDIFSNSSDDGIWRFEQDVNVSGSASSGFNVDFPITHLTFFLAGEFAEACSADRAINFTGDWMENSSSYPVTVEAIWGGNVIASAQYSISANSATISLTNLPAEGVNIVVRNSNGDVLAETIAASCGQTTKIALPDPGNPANPTSTLQLYVRCPDKTDPITLLPTFQLYYRSSGTGAYQYLGTVTNGFLRTTLLRTDGTKYDFKAIWNNRVKVVTGKEIQEDNTATVGLQPGDIMGTKAGATNLAILTEECGKM